MYIGLVLAILLFAVGWLIIIVTFTKKDNDEKKETMEFLNKNEQGKAIDSKNGVSYTDEVMYSSRDQVLPFDLEEDKTVEWTNELFE